MYKKTVAILNGYKNLRFTPGFHEPPKDQHVSFHQARWEGLHEVIFLKHTENVSNDPIQNQILWEWFCFVFKGIGFWPMCTYQRLEVLDILDVQVSHDVEMGRIIDPATVIELGEILVIHVNLYRDEILTLVIF